MKKLILVFAALLSSNAYALEAIEIKTAIEQAQTIDQLPVTNDVYRAIERILDKDPYLKSKISQETLDIVAFSIAKASHIASLDWKTILAILYVESRLCYSVRGDKKENAKGNRLYDYWSVGCMQINLKWWGKPISEAGFSQQDMLEYENNIMIGALILKEKIERWGWYGGIKRYNGSGSMAEKYREKVLKIYKIIEGKDE